MKLKNQLESFAAQTRLRIKILKADEIDFANDDSTHTHFGFKRDSKQSRFFTDRTTPRHVVGLLYEGGSPVSMADPRVVCRLCGVLDRDGSRELWHISVNSFHPLNDSAKGTRWGVHNVESYTANGYTRWKSFDGTNITQRNARAHVRGTPNPYSVECLVRCVEHLNCPSVRQHDAMPCAKLFTSQYDQKTHPATMLIYEALNFTKAPGLQHYVWHRSFMPGLIHSYARSAQQMHFGISVI